jgi:hypothetical protein
MNRALIIGAFDRDNFGDILYLVILKRLGYELNITPAGIALSDMREFIDEVVYPYPLMISKYKWNLIWVIGGEVGGVSLDEAIRMVLDKEEEPRYREIENPELKKLYNNYISYDQDMSTVAYIPVVNRGQSFVLSSVGLSSLSAKFNNEQKKARNSIALAKSIIVRDPKSVTYLAKYGITSKLEPDMVHILPQIYTPSASNIPVSYVAVQLSENFVNNNGVKPIAKALDSIIDSVYKNIVFIAAGTANYHDNYGLYKDIKNHMSNSARVTISKKRKPLDIVDIIANSDLVIGTSLHIRIVAMSYGVDRISLENTKVSNYASYWDGDYPHGITLESLTEQIIKVDTIKKMKKITTNNVDLSHRVQEYLNKVITLGGPIE